MQHALDYISSIIPLRLVCKTWCEHINNMLVTDEHPICFDNKQLFLMLIEKYPQRINNYFHICVLSNRKETLKLMPPININKYIHYAVRARNINMLNLLLFTHNTFDANALCESTESLEILEAVEQGASIHIDTSQVHAKVGVMRRQNRKKFVLKMLPVAVVVVICIIIFITLSIIGLVMVEHKQILFST